MALQRYRIGPNFRFVEVNRPRCPVHSSARDGPLNVANQTGEVNYFPSEFANQVCTVPSWHHGSFVLLSCTCAHHRPLDCKLTRPSFRPEAGLVESMDQTSGVYIALDLAHLKVAR